jgi:translation initiation factor 1A
MVNKIGGKKHKRQANETSDRILIFKEDLQEYAHVVSMLGNGRCLVKLENNQEVLGSIRGAMRKNKREYIKKGDLVLVCLRDYQKDKVDIVHVYNESEIKSLIRYNELNETDICKKEDEEFVVFCEHEP